VSEKRIVRLPFLHDNHSHVSLYAALAGLPDLEAFPSGLVGKAQALAVIEALPHDGLSIVTGWHNDRFTFDPADLASLPPAIIVNSSLHGFILTHTALSLAQELWPELALHHKDEEWIERNIGPTFSFYTRLAGFDEAKLEAFMLKMESLGIGSLDDMTIASEEAFAIIASSRFASRIRCWATPEVYMALSPAVRARCLGIKIYLDGSIGARSASIDAPFLDGSEGKLLYTDEELRAVLREVASYGTGLSAHALGHRCIEQILRFLEGLNQEGIVLPSVRLEHLQFIDLKQALRCKELGIVLSMQPNFNADSVDYTDRLIPRHLAENDPFRILIDKARFVPGTDLVFGSDGMPHGSEFPLQWSLFPAYEGQRLSVEEFAEGYQPSVSLKADASAQAVARPLEGEGSSFEIDDAARRIRRLS
jgi:predicted amidohydrolase YtcJ